MQVRTASGVPVAVSGVQITLSLQYGSSSATLSGAVNAVTDDAGSTTFADLSVDVPDFGYTLVATSDDLASASSATFTVFDAFRRAAGQQVPDQTDRTAADQPDAVSSSSVPTVMPVMTVTAVPSVAGARPETPVEVNPDAVNLRTAAAFAALAQVVSSTGTTVLNGDLGVQASTAVTGFPPGVVNGGSHLGDPAATVARADLVAAVDAGSTHEPSDEIHGNLADRAFHRGVHHQATGMALDGTVILDAKGDPESVFIFRTDADLDIGPGSSIVLANGAQAANVYWIVAGVIRAGAGGSLSGSMLARGAIALAAHTVLTGRVLSLDTVTLTSNTVTRPGFTAPVVEDLVEATAATPSVAHTVTIIQTTPGTTPVAVSPTDTAPQTALETSPATAPDSPEPEPTVSAPVASTEQAVGHPETTPPESPPGSPPAPTANNTSSASTVVTTP